MLSRSLIGLCVAVGAIGACRSDRSSEDAAAAPATQAAAPSVASYTFTAADYAFNGPAQIPAGTATFRLVNQGREPHHLVLVRLDEGKKFEDVGPALQRPGPLPPWMHAVGGPNAVDPGRTSNATLTLTPGLYAMICFIPGSDGVPHLGKGMVGQLEVITAADSAAPMPAADVVVKLSDYAFDLSVPLQSGSRTILVENAGPQFHEIVLARLAPGKTIDDLGAWARGGFRSPPPASFLGGVSPMNTGERNVFKATLEPGEYALLCFLPDANDGKEHLMHGMAKQVTVN